MTFDYDVAIMGGGPAGASLGARLCAANLRTIVIEEQTFPREHIGESFASPAIPCLVEIGALTPVLESGCSIRKFGGYYAWDSHAPSAAYFRHRQWEIDGVRRWSIHVDRAAFDDVLLRHAECRGAVVCEGAAVASVSPGAAGSRVHLRDGRQLTCRIFVDASGRMNRAASQRGRGWLSSYRNVAIWTHFAGGMPAQSLAGEWNIFRSPDLSPIGCFACDLGWAWYIPVVQTVDGRSMRTHSIGIVTDPEILKRPATRLTEPDTFIRTLHAIPLLRDLIRDVKPVRRELRTATNYSMISDRMCDYDERRISIGDAAFFVDPLFSSGVSFAMLQAAGAARLIEATFSQDLTEDMKRELWDDFTHSWTASAVAFAASIDQWYAAIAHGNPNSVYWNERTSDHAFFARMNSFEWLLDADVTSDLVHVMTHGSRSLSALPDDGALKSAARKLASIEPADDSRLRVSPAVVMRRSMTLNGHDAGLPDPWTYGPYWTDPVSRRREVAPLCGEPRACFRFQGSGDGGDGVWFFDEQCGRDLLEALEAAPTYAKLRSELPHAQWDLLLRLLAANLMLVDGCGSPLSRPA